MIELRIEVRRPDEDRWYYATGEGLSEALATLYGILREEPTYAPHLLVELEAADVPWCGELHPVPDVLRFQLEAMREAAERVQELRTKGAGPTTTIQVVEAETAERRRRAMDRVLERDAQLGEP